VIGFVTKYLLTQKYGFVGGLLGSYYQILERKLLKGSDRIIAISDVFLDIAKDWGVTQNKKTVLPNWAPLDNIPVLEKNNPWAQAKGFADKFVFLYSGILGLKHDHQVFRSLANHFRGYKDVVIVVVSDGPGAKWLLKIKETDRLDNLIVLPFQPSEDFAFMLASADVLVGVLGEQAGKFSVPSKVLSYLCARRPILLSASADNDAAKIIRCNETGLVAPPGDNNQFCLLANKLYREEKLRNYFGKNARSYAENKFDISIIAKRFAEML